MKSVSVSVCKVVLVLRSLRSGMIRAMALAFILGVLISLPSGCSFEQMGETAAEGRRRHERNYRIQQQQMMEDLDKALYLDQPSKRTDNIRMQ